MQVMGSVGGVGLCRVVLVFREEGWKRRKGVRIGRLEWGRRGLARVVLVVEREMDRMRWRRRENIVAEGKC